MDGASRLHGRDKKLIQTGKPEWKGTTWKT